MNVIEKPALHISLLPQHQLGQSRGQHPLTDNNHHQQPMVLQQSVRPMMKEPLNNPKVLWVSFNNKQGLTSLHFPGAQLLGNQVGYFPHSQKQQCIFQNILDNSRTFRTKPQYQTRNIDSYGSQESKMFQHGPTCSKFKKLTKLYQSRQNQTAQTN